MLDTKFTKKAVLLGTAAVALSASATSMAALVPNGDFESGLDSWALEFAGGSTFSHSATGGNPDGYLVMDNTSAAWGGVAVSTDDPAGSLLADFGLTAGETASFLWDMKSSAATSQGGIKVESWNEAGFLSTTGDQFFASTTDWASYSYDYTVDAGATRLKIVLLGIDNSSVFGYDNVCVNDCATAPIPVPAAAWLFGSGLLGLFGVARRKKA